MPLSPSRTPAPNPPVVLCIAGSDSSGGAGIQADCRTLAALGCHGRFAVTAVTAQGTNGYFHSQAMEPKILSEQLRAVAEHGFHAVKIGMLPDARAIAIVAEFLSGRSEPVVLDPVLESSSGSPLLDPRALPLLVESLLPLVTLITPNVPEATRFTGVDAGAESTCEKAMRRLCAMGPKAVCLKGGHLAGEPVDRLFVATGETWARHGGARIVSRNLRGTGCTFSSAAAAFLARGSSSSRGSSSLIAFAVERAHAFVRAAIEGAVEWDFGSSPGPVNAKAGGLSAPLSSSDG